MLVLARQRDETIKVGDDIDVTVVDIRGDKVRLGITAPKTVGVHRLEVYKAIQAQRKPANGEIREHQELVKLVAADARSITDRMMEVVKAADLLVNQYTRKDEGFGTTHGMYEAEEGLIAKVHAWRKACGW